MRNLINLALFAPETGGAAGAAPASSEAPAAPATDGPVDVGDGITITPPKPLAERARPRGGHSAQDIAAELERQGHDGKAPARVAGPQATEQADLEDDTDVAELGLDALLDAAFDDDPVMQGVHKGLKSKEVIEALPTDAKKLVQNLRADYSRKTAELAEQRRQVEAMQQQLLDRQNLETAEAGALFDGEAMQQLEALAKEPDTPFDLYDEAQLQKFVQQQAARMTLSLLSEQRDRVGKAQRVAAMQSWVETSAPELRHPDKGGDSEVRIAVHKLVTDKGYRVEDAYRVVMADRIVAERQAKADNERARRDAARDGARSISTGRRSSERGDTFDPRGKTALEIAEHVERGLAKGEKFADRRVRR